MVEYTIDDIRGPTVAREMAQLKSFVLEKFNGAIADAETAAAAAATAAANAVLGSLTSRVVALEGDMTTAQGDIITNANAILALDGAAVKLAGAQTISGIKQVPLEATGTASGQIASSQKVKNELDNYAAMVRTTGNIAIDGVKTFLKEIVGFFRFRWYNTSGTNAGKWVKVASIPSNMLHFILIMDSRYDYTILTGSNSDMLTKTHAATGGAQSVFKMVKESDGSYTLWFQIGSNYNAYYVRILNAERYGSELDVTPSTDATYYDTPTAGVSYFDSQEMAQ